MTTESPISRARSLANLLPLVVILWIGFYSHKQFGTDGVAGLLLGVYLILYTVFAVRKWKPEELSPFRKIIYRFRVVLIIAGLASMIGGALDIYNPPKLKAESEISEQARKAME